MYFVVDQGRILVSIESDWKKDRGICTEKMIRSEKEEGILQLICFAGCGLGQVVTLSSYQVQRSMDGVEL